MSNKKMDEPGEKSSIKGIKSEAGFTMIEAIVAIFVLTIGLVGTVAAITYALEFSAISRNVGGAKSLIVASIEEVETLRNAQRLDFKQIANVGGVDNIDSKNPFNGFSVGFKQISKMPGPDGVNGTDDDLIAPGADNQYGTKDDFTDSSLAIGGYLRQITITDLEGSTALKKVEVKVRYLGRAGKQGEITGVSYLNDDARTNR